MTWRWDQSAGALTHNGEFIADGYPGRDWGKNNPRAETTAGIGPIPVGRWKIGAPYDSQSVRAFYAVAKLDPIDARPGDDTDQRTGRGAFRISRRQHRPSRDSRSHWLHHPAQADPSGHLGER